MKFIVLCVDRDDDIGVKAGIHGPVVGREENINAAVALGIKDPEDSDVNSIMAAVSIYDDLKKSGLDAEVATISGDVNVGLQSDRVLTTQLDMVLERTQADRAILVSDGMEDEYIFPMISSRIKIDSVKRVYIKQSQSLEGFYYLIVKTLRDQRWRRKIVTPMGLVLITLGLINIMQALTKLNITGPELNPSAFLTELSSFYLVSFVVGIYLLWRSHEMGKNIRDRYLGMRDSLAAGYVAILFTLPAFMLIILGILTGFEAAKASESGATVWLLTLFGGGFIFWILAIMVYESGRVVEAFLTKRKIPTHFYVIMGTLIILGLVLLVVIDFIDLIIRGVSFENLLVLLYIEIGFGLVVALAGGVYTSLSKKEEKKKTDWRY